MRSNGYVGDFGKKNLTHPVAPATTISYKTVYTTGLRLRDIFDVFVLPRRFTL